MGKNMYQVQIQDEIKQYEGGTSYEQLAKEYQEQFPDQIVLAIVNGKLQELPRTIEEDCRIEFVTTGSATGMEVYKRSMCLMLVKAIYDVAGQDHISKVRILFSVDKGYYGVVEGEENVNEEFLCKVQKRMQEIVAKEIPILKKAVHKDVALETFHNAGMYDKERLFYYRRVSAVNIYSLDGFEDYFYGYMVPNTSYLKYFELYPYDQGFVLQMPTTKDSKVVPEFCPQQKVFQVLKESTKWGDMIGLETVADLNDQITHQDLNELILVEEALQEKKIADIASEIARRKSVKFVLIAGPSSSGKTTFSHRLSVQLRALGLTPHPIAVDNYFVDRELTPKHPDGSYNFECLEAIDIELFNKNLIDLLAGKEVTLPTFNFKTGKREYNLPPKKLGKQDILVIEGIHCLNDKLTYKLPMENKFKIYISALTQLNIDEHNRISTTDGRLLRRLVRDARTRGTSAQQTIAMWPSVRQGEEANIFPYQEEADAMFNSAMNYELAVLKQYVEPSLFAIDPNCKEFLEAKRLLKFLDYFIGISADNVPRNSLIREFIGGGCFQI